MSVWVLHLPLNAQQEAGIREWAELPLPFDAVPDLSGLANAQECRRLFRMLYPGEPPESVSRKADRIWHIYSSLHPDDVIAVPLQAAQEVAIATVTGPYRYTVGEDAKDMHSVPVQWLEKKVKQRELGKFRKELDFAGESMVEVASAEARTAIRDFLPHSYNRFAAWRWLVTAFFLMGAFEFAVRMLHR